MEFFILFFYQCVFRGDGKKFISERTVGTRRGLASSMYAAVQGATMTAATSRGGPCVCVCVCVGLNVCAGGQTTGEPRPLS